MKRLSNILGVSIPRIFQLSKRKNNPLPLKKTKEKFTSRSALIAEMEELKQWLKIEIKKPPHSQRRLNLQALKKELRSGL